MNIRSRWSKTISQGQRVQILRKCGVSSWLLLYNCFHFHIGSRHEEWLCCHERVLQTQLGWFKYGSSLVENWYGRNLLIIPILGVTTDVDTADVKLRDFALCLVYSQLITTVVVFGGDLWSSCHWDWASSGRWHRVNSISSLKILSHSHLFICQIFNVLFHILRHRLFVHSSGSACWSLSI